jgi:hypothetical protein
MLFRTFAGVVLAFCCKNRQRIETELIGQRFWEGATFTSRTILPASSTMQRLVSLIEKMVHAALLLLMLEAVDADLVSPSA